MKRNNYSAELKAEVVLEVLAGLKTVQQIGQERGMALSQIGIEPGLAHPLPLIID